MTAAREQPTDLDGRTDWAPRRAVPTIVEPDRIRLGHIARHVQAHDHAMAWHSPVVTETRLRVLAELLTDGTQQDIADRLALSRREVERHWFQIRNAMALRGGEVGRMTLLRIAAGFDPCWCETSMRRGATA